MSKKVFLMIVISYVPPGGWSFPGWKSVVQSLQSIMYVNGPFATWFSICVSNLLCLQTWVERLDSRFHPRLRFFFLLHIQFFGRLPNNTLHHSGTKNIFKILIKLQFQCKSSFSQLNDFDWWKKSKIVILRVKVPRKLLLS